MHTYAARGLITSSFSTGLRPYESYCHFSSGREGIVDTCNKTSKVGYFQRKLARTLGDLRLYYDGTVRDAERRIVLEKYDLNPSYAEIVPCRMWHIKDEAGSFVLPPSLIQT